MAIDPPYRLDPLQNPYNVKWGANVLAEIATDNSPSNLVRFLKSAVANWDTNILVTTTTQDAADSEVPVGGIDHFINDYLELTSSVEVIIDYRGYSTVRAFSLTVGHPTLQTKYYNSSREQITSIPTLPVTKGTVLFSDDTGIVYVTMDGTAGHFGRVKKYDPAGDLLWTIDNRVSSDTSVNLDDDNNILIANGSDNTIKRYNVSTGALMDTLIDFDPLIEIRDVSRKGKVYGTFSDGPFGTLFQPGIKAYSKTGTLLWTIPANNDSGDNDVNYLILVAYGEKYLIATANKNLGSNTHTEGLFTVSTPTTRYYTIVINADTGAELSRVTWGDHMQKIVSNIVPTHTQTTTQQGYWNLGGLARNDYYPPSPT